MNPCIEGDVGVAGQRDDLASERFAIQDQVSITRQEGLRVLIRCAQADKIAYLLVAGDIGPASDFLSFSVRWARD